MAKAKNSPVSSQESLKDASLKVVSPLGEVTVEEQNMVPRLDMLEGKTICFTWNRSFKSNVTLSVIAESLLKKYPTAKVIPYTEMPRSFKAPAPGTTSPEQIALATAFKEKGCDAVISGNGG
jgi:hypothetical protein